MTGLDALPDAVLVLDTGGAITAANRALGVLTGFDPDALIGAEGAGRLRLRRVGGTPLAATGPLDVELLHRRRLVLTDAAGDDLVVDATAASGADGTVVVALRPAEADSDAIEIVSTVSHELRSPLTSVKGYTSLLLNRWDRLDDDKKRMMLEQVHRDADRVTRMVTELLDISRLETGRLVLRRQRVDLAELAGEVIAAVTVVHPDLTAEVRFADGFPVVLADPDKVTQVLTNLVENAAKYASPAGLRVEGDVVGAAGAGPQAVQVAVHDRGEGIPAEDLGRVFTKFFRRDHGRPTGMGLGLGISRVLVEAHGGELTVTSTPDEGSTFAFTLPLIAFDDLVP
ncbi:ATP-binding protein [soil metagenome]